MKFIGQVLILIALTFLTNQVASAVPYNQCPQNSKDAYNRYEQIEPINVMANGLGGNLVATVQHIESSIEKNGDSKPIGKALKFTAAQLVLPGYEDHDSIRPLGNDRTNAKDLTYALKIILDKQKDLATSLLEKGVGPNRYNADASITPYFSKLRFNIEGVNQTPDPQEIGGRAVKVWRYRLKPKTPTEIKVSGAEVSVGNFKGEFWIDAETCLPVAMSGELTNLPYPGAVVDRFYTEFSGDKGAYYPRLMRIRTRLNMFGSFATTIFNRGVSYKSTDVTIQYLEEPDFFVVHPELLEKNGLSFNRRVESVQSVAPVVPTRGTSR